MRTLVRLALAASLASGLGGHARAQAPRAAGGAYAAPYPRGRAFEDESLVSINRSYLGYGNSLDRRLSPTAPGYVTGRAAPARRGRWFGRRRGDRY